MRDLDDGETASGRRTRRRLAAAPSSSATGVADESLEDFALEPLYEGLGEAPLAQSAPGKSPFLRGSTGTGAGWEIRQIYCQQQVEALNRAVCHDLENGVTAIELRLDSALRQRSRQSSQEVLASAGDGLLIGSVEDLEQALQGVALDSLPVALDAGERVIETALLLAALWQRRGVAPATAVGCFGADPLAQLASTGELVSGVGPLLDGAVEWARFAAAHYPRSRTFRVDTEVYHLAGASDAQELAAAVATGVVYLERMLGAGLGVEDACRQIVFRYSVDGDLFGSMAKLRAARFLWWRIASACGAREAPPRVEARTATRILTRLDPLTNLLRGTASAVGAVLGGAESVVVAPLDAALGTAGDFGVRLARNTQLILANEAGMRRVTDPGGGSWYLEARTRALAESAWRIFQQIAAAGGMASVLADGSLRHQIEAVAEARAGRVARRQDGIVGVSLYPDPNESSLAPPASDGAVSLSRFEGDRLDASLEEAQAGEDQFPALMTVAGDGAGLFVLEALWRQSFPAASRDEHASAPRFEPKRLAAPFESLRGRSESEKALFLASVGGPSAETTSRATWVGHLLAAGGLAVWAPEANSVAEVLASFGDSGLCAALVCRADDLPEDEASIVRGLKEAGARWVGVVGPARHSEALARQAGADRFVHEGIDVLALLGELHAVLDGEPSPEGHS